MALPIKPRYPPMEALSVDKIPTGNSWRYEPKWDGFRCLAFKDDNKIDLQSKKGESLSRYFPELIGLTPALLQRLGPPGALPVKPGAAIRGCFERFIAAPIVQQQR
jgi:ATP-dependent DNA ligase